MKQYIDIALIITSLALIASVILQNKGVGMGALTGSDSGGVFSARRGIEDSFLDHHRFECSFLHPHNYSGSFTGVVQVGIRPILNP